VSVFIRQKHTNFFNPPYIPTTEQLADQCLLSPTGNSTFAGATAAIMANVVLVAYVIVAMREDQSEQYDEKKRKEGKKDR